MEEVLPIAAGAIVGLLALRVRSTQLRIVAVLVLSVLLGVLASFITGELAMNWTYVVLDIAQVGFAALVAAAVGMWAMRRQAQVRR